MQQYGSKPTLPERIGPANQRYERRAIASTRIFTTDIKTGRARDFGVVDALGTRRTVVGDERLQDIVRRVLVPVYTPTH